MSYPLKSSMSTSSLREQVKTRRPKLIQVLNSISNMVTFGLGLVSFTAGFTYLTTYSYKFSLTIFSIGLFNFYTSFIQVVELKRKLNLLAGFLLSTGFVLIVLPIVRVFYKRQRIQLGLILSLAIILLVLFFTFFILGIVGLSLQSNGSFEDEAAKNFLATVKKYDQTDPTNRSTQKIDWLQGRFNCCGIIGYGDWKASFSYLNPNLPVDYYNKNRYYHNGMPYVEDVPDSCCREPHLNCGRQANTYGKDKSTIIHTKGCLYPYLNLFYIDISYLSILSTILSILFLIDSVALFILFRLLRRNLAANSFNKNQKRVSFQTRNRMTRQPLPRTSYR